MWMRRRYTPFRCEHSSDPDFELRMRAEVARTFSERRGGTAKHHHLARASAKRIRRAERRLEDQYRSRGR